MKVIETTYKGLRFRSRLEARVAVLLDEAKIKYLYEPEGFVFEDGTTYLPDFYLPNMDMFLECKGIMSDKDETKMCNLAKETGKEIVIFGSDLIPWIGFYVDDRQEWYPTYEKGPGLITDCGFIAKCNKCHQVYFAAINGDWSCKCCGYHTEYNYATCKFLYDGEPDLLNYEPIKKARSKRFEFGEGGGK